MSWAQWRTRAGLSQRELAERVGVTPSMISLVEKGERGMSLELLQRLASTLSLSPEERLQAAGLAEVAGPDAEAGAA